MSKYYPVANYSYPRKDSTSSSYRAGSPTNRSSLGSDGSAPGLIDDRTDDSEVSLDDDYQYHSHTTELWDSFWQHEAGAGKRPEPVASPKKLYPALIPSPQRRRKHQQTKDGRPRPAWPLPEHAAQGRMRKPAATYSPFPKTVTLPPRTTSLAPPSAKPRPAAKPRRPARPDNELLIPCVKQPSPVTATFARSLESPSSGTRPLTPLDHRPMTPLDARPSTPFEVRPPTPFEAPATIRKVRSFHHTYVSARDSASSNSTVLPSPTTSIPKLPPPEPEPHSVFEYDDDSDSEPHGRSFFRFHKRSDSDSHRKARVDQDTAGEQRRRARAKTAPSSPSRPRLESSASYEEPERKRQPDVLSRMLGRRSR